MKVRHAIGNEIRIESCEYRPRGTQYLWTKKDFQSNDVALPRSSRIPQRSYFPSSISLIN